MTTKERQSLNFATPAGVFDLVGQFYTDQERPALVAVSGSFPPKGHLHELADRFPGVSVVVAYLPGQVRAPWSESSMAELSKGFEEVLLRLFPETRIVLFGHSTGNLLTLGVTRPNIVRRIALEPFFSTAELWPFIANSRERMAKLPDHQELRRYLWTHFGISESEVEGRDYSHLLANITQPTDVMFGDLDLLPQRDLPTWPTLLKAEHREALAKNPLVTLHRGPPGSGHNIAALPGEEQKVLHRLIHTRLREAWPEAFPAGDPRAAG